MRKLVDSVIVAIAFDPDPDKTVLTVGRKRLNESLEVINAFQGQEAIDIYNKLTTKVTNNTST